MTAADATKILTPDDTGDIEDFRVGAGEPVASSMTTTSEQDDDPLMSLLLLADILNVIKHPVQDRQTHC